MDLHRILLKGNQKPNMGPYIPQAYGTEFFPVPQNGGFHTFTKDYGLLPYKSFSCPNSFTSFKLTPEKFINEAVDFTRGMQKTNNFPAMSLTCIVGGFVNGGQGVWKSSTPSAQNNSFENMFNQIISKSVEITRTMSCPDPFNFNDIVIPKPQSKEVSPRIQEKQNLSPMAPTTAKMSYAEVAKMNLSNFNKGKLFSSNKNSTSHSSSQKSHCLPCGRKEAKSSSPSHNYTPVSKNNFRHNRNGTSSSINKSEKESGRARFIHNYPAKTSNSRRPQVRRLHTSGKRELGTKRNNQKVDFDGSVWGRDNMDADMCEDSVLGCSPTSASPHVLLRMRSGSSESDCSSEVSDHLKNPRVRSLSECSVNSIDSEDSFIVFDECPDDSRDDDSYEESSSDESDECSSGYSSCNGTGPQVQSSDYLQSINSKWETLHPETRQLSNKSQLQLPNVKINGLPQSPCAVTNALKKVRFACGEALAKVRKLCVWDYAHRAARIGPWEQAARDRDRFSKRVASLAPVLNPVLDPAHRHKIYDDRFAPR